MQRHKPRKPVPLPRSITDVLQVGPLSDAERAAVERDFRAQDQITLYRVRLEAKDMNGGPGRELEVTLAINEGLATEVIFRATMEDAEEETAAGYLLGRPLNALFREARNALHAHTAGEPPRPCPLCGEGREQSPDQVREFIREFQERERAKKGRRW